MRGTRRNTLQQILNNECSASALSSRREGSVLQTYMKVLALPATNPLRVALNNRKPITRPYEVAMAHVHCSTLRGKHTRNTSIPLFQASHCQLCHFHSPYRLGMPSTQRPIRQTFSSISGVHCGEKPELPKCLT